MAVIGARPATGFGWLGGGLQRRTRVRSASRAAWSGAARRRREAAGVSRSMAVIAAAAGLALFYLSQSSHVAATGYRIEDLRDRLAEVRAEQEQLIWEIARAQSPAVIEQRAKAHLKLVPLGEGSIRFASPSTDAP
jgi:cell division protein FtsB